MATTCICRHLNPQFLSSLQCFPSALYPDLALLPNVISVVSLFAASSCDRNSSTCWQRAVKHDLFLSLRSVNNNVRLNLVLKRKFKSVIWEPISQTESKENQLTIAVGDLSQATKTVTRKTLLRILNFMTFESSFSFAFWRNSTCKQQSRRW